MKFAKWVFLVAGVYGLIVTVPLYFMEERLAIAFPPPLTHPENFYAFIGVTAAWQVLFLVLSRDPVRFRPLMFPCVLEKASALITYLILFPGGRFPQLMIPFLFIDLTLGVLFAVAFVKTKTAP